MTNEKEPTRGLNFVKKWGRARPAFASLIDFCSDISKIDNGNGQALSSFFGSQLGVDRKLKFWHCEMRHFPKLNERAGHETSGAASATEEYYNNYNYPFEGHPSGLADPYFKDDPLQPDTKGIPFRIIHTRSITNDRAKMAALSFIEQDDFLRDIFNWGGTGDAGAWDGKNLLGIDYSKRLATKSEIIEEAKSNWFVWSNGNPMNPKSLDIEKHGVTVISDSAIRTWNWYLKHTDQRLVTADRIEDIANKFRGEPWSTPTALKSFRLDWPVMRNIEEASQLSETTITKTIEDLVTNYLGDSMRSTVLEKMNRDFVRTKEDKQWQYEGVDGGMVHEKYTDMWELYVNAIKPLGQKAEWALETGEEPEQTQPPSELMKKLDDAEKVMDGILKRFSIIDDKTKGGHAVTKSGNEITVERISPAPENALREMQMIQVAMLDPVPFETASAAIYTKLEGKLKNGLAVDEDFQTTTFVGYKKTVSSSKTNYEGLAELANKTFDLHFSGMRPAHGSDQWVTPEMIKWASGGKKTAKNVEIICPDPRTITKEIRNSLTS
jgi:hypothetical protein